MSFTPITTRSSSDPNSSADINQLNENILCGGYYPVSIATTTVITSSDIYTYYQVSNPDGDVDVTLPTLSAMYGKRIRIELSEQTGSNIITVGVVAGDTITGDGLTSIELPVEGNFIDVFASSVTGQWEILNESISSYIIFDTQLGYGSADTKIIRFTNATIVGNMIAENHSTGYNGGTEGIELSPVLSGVLKLAYVRNSSSNDHFGISVDSAQLTTNYDAIAAADQNGYVFIAANSYDTLSINMHATPSNKLRAHSRGVGAATAASVKLFVSWSRD